jgi:hypothetical protein
MENNQLNSSYKLPDFDKDKGIDVILGEPIMNGLRLVGIWQGKNRLATFSVSREEWEDRSQLLKIVDEMLLNREKQMLKWKK